MKYDWLPELDFRTVHDRDISLNVYAIDDSDKDILEDIG